MFNCVSGAVGCVGRTIISVVQVFTTACVFVVLHNVMSLSATRMVYFPSGAAPFTGCTIYGYLRIGDPALEYSISWRRILENKHVKQPFFALKRLTCDSFNEALVYLNGARGKAGVIAALLGQCFVRYPSWCRVDSTPLSTSPVAYKKVPALRIGSQTFSSRAVTKGNWSGAALQEFSRKPTKGISLSQVYIRP